MTRKRVAVLISGRGSNMAALIAAAKASDYPAEIALVVSNVPDAGGLAIAKDAGLTTAVVEHRAYGKDRAAFEHALQDVLQAHKIELVCLAGFMRLLTPAFLAAFPGRVMNIHPALLPAFPGVHSQKQALDYGARVTGCTVHFVDEGTDTGPIIAQAAVPVLDGDDEATLAARILVEEHRLYPAAIRAVADGRVRVEGRRVKIVP